MTKWGFVVSFPNDHRDWTLDYVPGGTLFSLNLRPWVSCQLSDMLLIIYLIIFFIIMVYMILLYDC